MSVLIRKRALARAAEILGGEQALAAYLRTDTDEIRRWKRASTPMPERVLQSLFRVLRAAVMTKAAAKRAIRKR